MITFLGDSNFRDLFSGHKEQIEKEVNVTIEFSQVSSVASTKTYLEAEEVRDMVFIGCPLNEISLKSKNNTKSREGIVETVITDFYTQIAAFAQKYEKKIFVICQPFLRVDPPWMEAKLSFIEECVKKTHNTFASNNVHLGSVYDITQDDLKADNTHLNSRGIDKLRAVVISDIKIAKIEHSALSSGSTEDESMEEGTPVNEARNDVRSLRKTPARRKRPLDDSDDTGKGKKKKGRDGIEAVLDKLDIMMEKMNGDKAITQARFDKLEERIEETSTSHAELKKEVDKISKADNSFSASVREDLDSVENLNARDTIIVKRLAATGEIPNDKKDLTNLIVTTAREIITLVLGSDKAMKFASPLYFSNNRRIAKEGERKELPPFRITFKLLSDSLEFKEKAITASKDPSSRLFKAYFSYQQAVGTRIRLSILWGIADALKKEKKDSWVSQSSPKPCLMVKDAGPLVKTYCYLEAIDTFGEKVDPKILDEAKKLANRFFYGQVEKVFVILKD
jgi:hypothetical protein